MYVSETEREEGISQIALVISGLIKVNFRPSAYYGYN